MLYLTLCAIVKNEAPYLREWLAFHRAVGVERFYLYDHGSSDETAAIAAGEKDVVLRKWARPSAECAGQGRFKDTPQIKAFNQHCWIYGQQSRWCMFTDPDEYLYHRDTDDLRAALEEYEEFPGLGVHWLVFGDGGHAIRPACPTIQAYTRRAVLGGTDGWFCSIKSIVQPTKAALWGPYGSHAPVYKEGHAVNERKEPIAGGAVYGFAGSHPNPRPTADLFRCNHYFTRSREEYAAKAAREDANNIGNRSPHCTPHANRNEVEDTDILRFLPRVKKWA